MQLAATLAILMALQGPDYCNQWEAAKINDREFVLDEGYGCTARASEWRQDGTWTEAAFTGCVTDFNTPAPDQTGRFRLVKHGDGPTMVEFSLFPEDGVLQAHLCSPPETLGEMIQGAYERRQRAH
jgi:hypothetical protein